MASVPQYGRWQREFDEATRVERVEFTGPDGTVETRPAFAHQPARLVYDDRGYETTEPAGDAVLAVRFCPDAQGAYQWRAVRSGDAVEEGGFECDASAHPGYVQVSARDSRYFALSDGTPFVPIGCCLNYPPSYPLPKGSEHFITGGGRGTLGCGDYDRWFRLLRENGANTTRIYLSAPYFEPEGEVAGELDLVKFARMDRVVELARQYGIRLKLCLELFRSFRPDGPGFFARKLTHPDDGRPPRHMDLWLTDQSWQGLWLKKVRAWFARYGDDPAVMAWELWNELECVETNDWSLVVEWARRRLKLMKSLAPRQLVTNTLGSFDRESQQAVYDAFHMDEMDFQQVHRYLDQGAEIEICKHDTVPLAADAVRRGRRADRPVLTSETGAVNDSHTGPFRYYRRDDRGIIFHDVTYAPFFAGAAGTGQCWHWEVYVDQKDLWGGFRPFADMLEGVDADAEGFEPVDLSDGRIWFLALRGARHVLAYVRNKQDNWEATLRDQHEPDVQRDVEVDVSALGVSSGKVELFRPWDDAPGEAELGEGVLRLPPFRYGLLLKVSIP